MTPSVFSIVSTRNPACTEYYSQYEEVPSSNRYANRIRASLINCLKAFKQTTGSLPVKIIIYRAGIADSEFENVIEHEGNQIKHALLSKDMCDSETTPYDEAYEPEYSYIVIRRNNRHRFYTKNPTKGDKLVNLPSGTVIDHTVTTKNVFDFFIVPQESSRPTLCPLNCNIIANTCKLKPEQFQTLTYKLCHLYYNVPAAVPKPCVVQYAKKCAKMIGETKVLRRNRNCTDPTCQIPEAMRHTLYYL